MAENKAGIYSADEPAKADKPASGPKPLIAVHDTDLNLGYQLHTADARSWGRDQSVVKELSSSADKPGGGKGGLSGGSLSGNSGANYGAASNSGDNSGMNSSGTSSDTGSATDSSVGTRRSGAAATESNSADERTQ